MNGHFRKEEHQAFIIKQLAMERGLLPYFAAAVALFFSAFAIVAQGSLGVNYGMQANNLPSPSQVIALCKSRNIHKLHVYGPNPAVLAAFQNSGISLILDADEQDLQQLGSNPAAAGGWVQANIVPYAGSVNFQYIVMGNEEIPGPLAGYILPAIYNVAGALKAAGLSIPVTTVVSMGVLGTTFPPSQGAFSNQALEYMGPIVSLLASRNTPLLVNVYPYFAYIGNPSAISLDYALFRASGAVVQDGNLKYWNLFDAMVDTVKSALERIGGGGVDVVVTESGWPSAGGPNVATIDNARTYMNNLVGHVYSKAGTPKSPGKDMDVYLFSMFNEDMKPAGTEQNYGMFYSNMNEVYHVNI